jgi:hypothetical protein
MTPPRRDQPDDRPVQNRIPLNIIKRLLRLSPMRRIKDAVEECTCRQPVRFYHRDGRVTCVRCRGRVEEVEA